jgi:hypothetical protein
MPLPSLLTNLCYCYSNMLHDECPCERSSVAGHTAESQSGGPTRVRFNCPVCHARIADGLGAGRFAPKFVPTPCSRLSFMNRLLIPHRQTRGHRASGSVVQTCRAAATGTTNRGTSGLSAMRRSLRRGASVPLRQNAAAMLLEARLNAVWKRSLAAIGYVNLYFHWDFPKFNI